MIPEKIKSFLNKNLWYVATCGQELNVVPVGFKRVCEDGRLAVGAVLFETTLENIKADSRIAVACADPLTGEAYQLKGSAELLHEGEEYDHYNKLTNDIYKGAMQLKCVIIITPEKIINASPNEHNKEEIEF